MRSALEAGVRVEPIPGASAITTSLMMTGQGAEGFTFLGFPPVKSNDRKRWFLSAATFPHPVVLFEAPHRIARTVAELAAEAGPGRQVRICREMTKVHEQVIAGTLADVTTHPDVVNAQGEFTVVLLPEHVVDEPLPISDATVWHDFCALTETGGLKRREAVSVVARRLGLSTREAYAAVERHRMALNGEQTE